MSITPIKIGFVNFKKCNLLENRILLGIDIGSSLSKFVFVNKKNRCQLYDESTDHINFQYSIFRNEDIEEALEWLKENAYIQEETKYEIHCTGTGGLRNKKKIESTFGLSLIYVQERLALIAGHKIALEHCPLENLTHPPTIADKPQEIDNIIFKTMLTRMQKRINTDSDSNEVSSLYPFVLGYWGSGSIIFFFDDNGKAQQIGSFENGGKSFLGMAKCLIDSNDYDDIVSLAAKGNRKNIDTLVKDILISDEKSPYGKFPPELPVFPFGKCAENNIDLQNYSKDDLAISLICLESSKISSNCRHAALITKTKRIYLSGNTFKSSLFHKEILNRNLRHPIGVEYTFLDLGYATALGAMFCVNQDREMYLK